MHNLPTATFDLWFARANHAHIFVSKHGFSTGLTLNGAEVELSAIAHERFASNLMFSDIAQLAIDSLDAAKTSPELYTLVHSRCSLETMAERLMR